MSNFMDKAKAKVKTAKDKTVRFVKDHAIEIVSTGITALCCVEILRLGKIDGYNKGFSDGVDLQCQYDNAVIDQAMKMNKSIDIKSRPDDE